DQIGPCQVLIAPRYQVTAKCAPVARDRGRHAETGVGVNLGAANEALHELVGDVVVFGEKLPRYVEGDRVGTMTLDRIVEATSHAGQCLVPTNLPVMNVRVQKASVEARGIAERRALRAE